MTNASFSLLALAAVLAAPAAAQYAPAPANDADRLAAEMRVIGQNPTDVVALTEAGELSTRLGDLSGAASLFARADKVDPRNGRVKAGMADVLLHLERPGEALQFYNQAEGYGYPVARFATERGLAYDLVAQQGRAQRDYRLALASGSGDDETVRRYALSLGIAGQKEAALQQLEPLLRRNDRAAWRARAFVLAMNGETGAAQTIATTMMAPGQASGMAAFFQRLPSMGPADRAFAVQFGEVRPTPQRLADLRLAPALPPLAPEVVAVARPAPPVQVAAVKPDKRKRGRKGEVQVAAVAPPPAAPALPPPPAYGGATRPVEVAALSPRALPPASYASRPVVGGYPAPQASTRVLPARSPLPPPPVLTRQVAPVTSAAPVALARTTPVAAAPATQPVAVARTTTPAPASPVALTQVTPPRDRFVPYERPGSILPGYVRVPGAASPARVTGTLSAPAVASPPAGVVRVAEQPRAVPGTALASPVAATARQPSATISPEAPRTPSAPVALAAGAPSVTRPAIQSAATDSVPITAAVVPVAATRAAPEQVAPSASGFGATASVPTTAAVGAAPVPGITRPLGAGAPAPTGAGELASTALPGLGATGTASPPVTSSVGGALALAAPVASPQASGATPAGEAATTQAAAIAAPATAAPAPTGTAGFSPATVGTAPEPIASGERAGVAVASAAPVRDGGLGQIVSALPVPASELNIAPPPPRHVAPPRQQVASLAADVPHTPPTPDTSARTRPRDSSPTSEAHPSGSRQRKTDASEDAAPTTRKHAAASDDASAPKAKGRKGVALADEPAPKSRKLDDALAKGRRASLAKADEDDTPPPHGKHGRKTSSDDDAPVTAKGRRAALAKADDDAPPARTKHGRHDDDTDAKPATGKRALAARHEAEPQKYWVQVAGGANEASLGKAWSIAQSKAPALAGRKGYTAPLHATNRVLAGPFKSDDEARAFVNTLNKQGVHAFQFTNDKGQKVRKLDDE